MIVKTPRTRSGRSAASVLLGLASVTILGSAACISGSLASTTGPRPPGHQWSIAPRQMVHVGETVQFDFVLQDASHRLVPPLGLVDYVAVDVQGRHIEAVADVNGHFTFTYQFDEVHPQQSIVVRVEGYRQKGSRDYMKVNGEWLHTASPFDRPDQPMYADTITLTVYRIPIELRLLSPRDDFDPSSGLLKIRRSADETKTVYIDRPHRRGFRIYGPDEQMAYRIEYWPDGDELNPSGTTDVEFVIYDVSGTPHYVSKSLNTP